MPLFAHRGSSADILLVCLGSLPGLVLNLAIFRTELAVQAIHQHIHEQFELARKLHERPRIAATVIEPEVSLTDRAAPIFRRIIPRSSS
jgi:hypothetical protein